MHASRASRRRILGAPWNWSSTTLDLNIYLVGLPGLYAGSAPTDSDFQDVHDETETSLGQAGVEFGEIRYFDVPADVEEEHPVIQSPGDAQDLAGHSLEPDSSDAEPMGVNVFVVEQFSMSNRGGNLGGSLGIPGAAGLHGSGLNGVVRSRPVVRGSIAGGVVGHRRLFEAGSPERAEDYSGATCWGDL